MRTNWLLYGLACALLLLGSTYYYDCKIKRVCAPAAVSAPSLTTVGPIVFEKSSAIAVIGPEFEQFKADLLAAGSSDRALQITGLRFSDESSDAAMDLGTLRAQAAFQNFSADLPIEQLKVSSDAVPQPAPEVALFPAVKFDWVALTAPVPIVQNTLPLSFAANSAAAVTGTDFPAFLQAFGPGGAQQSFEITGWYFEGESAALGQARAAAIRDAIEAQLALSQPKPNRTYVLNAQARAGAAPSGATFEAASFRWIDGLPAGGATEIAPTAITPAETAPAETDSTVLLTGYFPSNSSSLTSDADLMAQLEAFKRAAAGKTVRITGHTDSSGNRRKNAKLGQARAQALADWLRGQGAATEFVLVSSADRAPIADNGSASGKQQNRRATASVE